jgi:hypothetical protein
MPTLAEIQAEEERLRASLAAQGIQMPTGIVQLPTQEISADPLVRIPTQEIASDPALRLPTQEISGRGQGVMRVPTQEISAGPLAPPPTGVVDMRGSSLGVADVARMNAEDANAREGMRVAAMDSHHRREAAAASGAPTPGPAAPDGAPSMQVPNAPPARYVPAGWDDRRVPFRPETRAAFMRAQGVEADAVGDAARTRGLVSDALADAAGDEAERAQASMAARAAREDARQQSVRAQLGKLQEATDAAGKLEVNPDRWFQSRSTFQHIARIVGTALGGGIAAATGGRNGVADQIDGYIQRDIDTQKMNIALRQQNVGAQQNMLEQYQQAFGDERQGELALEHGMRELAIQKAQALAATGQSPLIKANGQQLLAQLQEAQLRTRMEFERLAYAQAHVVGGVGTTANNELFVPSLGGNARRPEEATDLRKRSGAILQIQANLRKAAKLREDIGKSGIALDKVWSDPRVAELESIVEETKPMYSVAFGQGAAGEAESKRYEVAMGGLMNFRGDPDQTARAAAERLGQNIEMLGKTSGIVGAQEGFRRNPKTGALENVQALTGERAAAPVMSRKVERTPVK